MANILSFMRLVELVLHDLYFIICDNGMHEFDFCAGCKDG